MSVLPAVVVDGGRGGEVVKVETLVLVGRLSTPIATLTFAQEVSTISESR